MDVGLGAFIEKFEQRFGARVTSVLLGLIGMAIAVLCCSVIWNTALGPAVAWVIWAFNAPIPSEAVALLAWYSLGIASGTFAGIALSQRYMRIRIARMREAKKEDRA